jgi:hypothetical protein
MADGFIVRKGGVVTEQSATPTITEVSVTGTSITFTITNNDASTAVILYEAGDTTPDENSIELATGVTSDSIEITGLTAGTTYTVYAWATVTGKVQSALVSEAIETSITYTAATGGTTEEYDSGGKRYKSHTFTSDDDFEVTTVGDATDDRNKVDVLVIAGGGAGGGPATIANAVAGGSGGAGGYLSTIAPTPGDTTPVSKPTVTATTYSIVIGSGGASVNNSDGNSGTNSSALGISSSGGGGGRSADVNNAAGISGGSGGSATARANTSISGGAGISGQGFKGSDNTGSNAGGGGVGGGASAAAPDIIASGTDLEKRSGLNGINGLNNNLRTGSNEIRGASGGGGAYFNGVAGTGGSGGGGNGGANRTAGSNATANTGSGGGGAGGTQGATATVAGGNGAAGIVVIRYEIAPSV